MAKKRVSKKKMSEAQAELFTPLAAFEPKIFSVGEFLDHINAILKTETFTVEGEVTGWKEHPSGVYFSLKDQEDGAIMDCYLNPYLFRGLGVAVEDGMKVRVSGAANVYKPKGRFSFRVEALELAGEGSLKKAYELLKKKLEAEGLFTRKRELPEFIQRIGVITSRTGAVIDDFRRNLRPLGLEVSLCDVRVEGAHAADQIIAAVRWFNKHRPDLDALVVIRGGGSLEDLQPFNNELVVRAVFASAIPTICSIGHHRDVPLTQMTADRDASTPSFAAQCVNDSWEPLISGLPRHGQALAHAFELVVREHRDGTAGLSDRLFGYFQHLFRRFADMERVMASAHARIGKRLGDIRASSRDLAAALSGRFVRALAAQLEKITRYDTYIMNVSPERNLKLGYSIIRNATGQVIRSIKDIRVGETLAATLHKGTFTSKVEKVQETT